MRYSSPLWRFSAVLCVSVVGAGCGDSNVPIGEQEPAAIDGGSGGSGGVDGGADGHCIVIETCVRGKHWHAEECACVVDVDAGSPAPCTDTVLCRLGTHWDSEQCTCVTNGCLSQQGGSCGGSVS